MPETCTDAVGWRVQKPQLRTAMRISSQFINSWILAHLQYSFQFAQIRSYQIFAKPMHAPLTFKRLGNIRHFSHNCKCSSLQFFVALWSCLQLHLGILGLVLCIAFARSLSDLSVWCLWIPLYFKELQLLRRGFLHSDGNAKSSCAHLRLDSD